MLFRESERADLRLWLRHLVRDRGNTPTTAQAIACGLILLTIRFFATFAAKMPQSWHEFAVLQFMTLALLVAGPVLLMTAFLTRSPRATLLLRPASGKIIGSALLLALTIHPVAMLVAASVQWLYPINEQLHAQIADMKQLMAARRVSGTSWA